MSGYRMPRYYAPDGGLPGLERLGATANGGGDQQKAGPLAKVYGVASLVSGPALAYHGYKRNDSVGWAIGWYFLGTMFWPIALPVAIAQGFAERKVNANRRRRTSRRRRRTSR